MSSSELVIRVRGDARSALQAFRDTANAAAREAKRIADTVEREARRQEATASKLARHQEAEARRSAQFQARMAQQALQHSERLAQRQTEVASRTALAQARLAQQAAQATASEARKAAEAAIREANRQATAAGRLAVLQAAEARKGAEAQAREARRAADATAREARRAAQTAAREAQQGASRMRQSLDGMQGIATRLAGALALVAGGTGLFARMGVEMNETLTRSTRSLTHLSGSAERAQQFVGELREEARVTAPTFRELLPIAQQLAAAYGGDLAKVLPTIRAFGDAAKVAGANTEQMKLALLGFRQILTSPNGVQRDEIRQVTENLPGVDVNQFLLRAFGTADADLLRKAKVTGQQVGAAIVAGMQAEFGGAQRNGADDIEVMISGVADQLEDFAGQITSEFTPEVKGALGVVSDSIRDLAQDSGTIESLREPFRELGEGIKAVAERVRDLIKWYRDLSPEEQKLAVDLVTSAGKFAALAATVLGAAAAVGKLVGWLKNVTPAGLAATAALTGFNIIAADLERNRAKQHFPDERAGDIQGRLHGPALRAEEARRRVEEQIESALRLEAARKGRPLTGPESNRIIERLSKGTPLAEAATGQSPQAAQSKLEEAARELKEAGQQFGYLGCARFVSEALKKTGFRGIGSASSTELLSQLKAIGGQVVTTPQAGDVFFSPSRGRDIGHTGIVGSGGTRLHVPGKRSGFRATEDPGFPAGTFFLRPPDPNDAQFAEARARVQAFATQKRTEEAEKAHRKAQAAAEKAAREAEQRRDFMSRLQSEALPEGTAEERRAAEIHEAERTRNDQSRQAREILRGKQLAEALLLIRQGYYKRVAEADAAFEQERTQSQEQRAQEEQRRLSERLEEFKRAAEIAGFNAEEWARGKGRSESDIARAGLQARAIALRNFVANLGPEQVGDDGARELRKLQLDADRSLQDFDADRLREAFDAIGKIFDEGLRKLKEQEEAAKRLREQTEHLRDVQLENAVTVAEQRGDQGEMLRILRAENEALAYQQLFLGNSLEDQIKLAEIQRRRLALTEQEAGILKNIAGSIAGGVGGLMGKIVQGMARGDAFDRAMEDLEREAELARLPDRERERQSRLDQVARSQGFTGIDDGKLSEDWRRRITEAVDAALQAGQRKRSEWRDFWRTMGEDATESFRSGFVGLFEGLFTGNSLKDTLANLFMEVRGMAGRAVGNLALRGLESGARSLFGRRRAGDGDGQAGNFDSDNPSSAAPGRGGGLSGTVGKLRVNVAGVAGALAGLINVFTNGKNKLATVLLSLIQLLGSIPLGGGGGTVLSGLFKGIGKLFGGMFADGGEPPVGKMSLVGERGPELFVPRVRGTIIPNHYLGRYGLPSFGGAPSPGFAGAGTGGRGPVTINFAPQQTFNGRTDYHAVMRANEDSLALLRDQLVDLLSPEVRLPGK